MFVLIYLTVFSPIKNIPLFQLFAVSILYGFKQKFRCRIWRHGLHIFLTSLKIYLSAQGACKLCNAWIWQNAYQLLQLTNCNGTETNLITLLARILPRRIFLFFWDITIARRKALRPQHLKKKKLHDPNICWLKSATKPAVAVSHNYLFDWYKYLFFRLPNIAFKKI